MNRPAVYCAQLAVMFDALREEVSVRAFPVSNVLADNAFTILTFIFFVFGHPLDKLVAEPETFSLHIVKLVSHIANAIFKTVSPGASIRLCAVLPDVSSLTVALVILEFASVLAGAI